MKRFVLSRRRRADRGTPLADACDGADTDDRRMGQVRIGTSGWVYKGWNETFYPAEVPRRAVLA